MSPVFLFLAVRAFAWDQWLARVQLVKTTFNEGRDVAPPGGSASGSLAQLVSADVLASNLSIVSRLRHASCLFGCLNCAFKLTDSKLEDLANCFGHFSNGGVSLESVAFKRCIRPVTMDYTCEYTPGQGPVTVTQHQDVTGTFRARTCIFEDCTSTTDGGGAVRLVSGSLDIDDIKFRRCSVANGWGAAIYAKVDRIIGLKMIEATDMTSTYTVVHIEHTSRGNFASVTFDGEGSPMPGSPYLKPNTFARIKITGGDEGDGKVEAGGMGLAVLYAVSLTLRYFIVQDCSFKQSSSVRKRAGCIMFEGTEMADITFEHCSFKNSPAKGGTGCIHVAPRGIVVNIDDVTVDGCGGSDESHPWAIYVNAWKASITTLVMKNMPGGMGRFHLGTIWNGNTLTLTTCHFETWRTDKLLTTPGCNYRLVLESCTFQDVTANYDSNFLQTASDGITSLTVRGCTWRGGTYSWAVIRGVSGPISITGGSRFEGNLQVPTAYLMTFTEGVEQVTIQSFSVVSVSVQGVMKMFSMTGSPTVTVAAGTFESITCRRNGDDPANLVAILAGSLASFEDCVFTGTAWDSGGALVQITVQLPDAGIRGCQFKGCSVRQAPFLQVSTSLKLVESDSKKCVFENLGDDLVPLLVAPVKISSANGRVVMNGVSFKSVKADVRNLVFVDGTATDFTVKGLEIATSSFGSVLSVAPTGIVTVTDGSFDVTNMNTMFDVNGDSCTFERCAFVGGYQKMINVRRGSLTLRQCDFGLDSAVGQSGSSPDVELQSGVTHLTLADCCFQQSDATRYIKGPSTVVVSAEKPLCFRRTEELAVDFGGEHKFDDLASEYKIFECTECDNPPTVEPPPDPFTASDTLEIIPTSDIPEPIETDEPTSAPTDEPTSAPTDEPTSAPTEDEDVPSWSITVPTETGPGDDGAKKSGNKAGEIVGILFAILLLIAVILLIIWFVLRRRKEKSDKSASDREMVEETAEETESTWSTVDMDAADGRTETNPLFAQEINTADLQFEERVWL